MNARPLTPMPSRARVAQFIVATQGVLNLFIGAALLFAPAWFFERIGHFPPFNRHYMGDLGAFYLAFAIALLWAARMPGRHRSLIGAVALGSLLHLGNHLYDDAISGAWSLSHALTETLPLAVLAALLLWVWLHLAAAKPVA